MRYISIRGWMGSDGENGDGGSSTGGYEPFQKGWDDSVAPVASFAPIMITEMDWAPSKYNASWGRLIPVHSVVRFWSKYETYCR